ncbi:MAG: peptidoglycan DD-metalloendopeptidase family protein, partial [Desulfobacteraceae bacterium]|nr:peptidoglycan DD-metalloendopeptidase family protein [Desulfobacteraceae bacterium]
MKYPYLAYSDNVNIKPIFNNLTGNPFIVDLSVQSKIFKDIDVTDQKKFQQYLDILMKDKYSWGLSSYLDNRKNVLTNYPQMIEEKRYFHLGLDIIKPCGTAVHSPLASIVKEKGYESGDGNYGYFVLLMHESDHFETFYSFYGHLSADELPSLRQSFKAGDQFAVLGDFHENGNWFYHTHLQIIT